MVTVLKKTLGAKQNNQQHKLEMEQGQHTVSLSSCRLRSTAVIKTRDKPTYCDAGLRCILHSNQLRNGLGKHFLLPLFTYSKQLTCADIVLIFTYFFSQLFLLRLYLCFVVAKIYFIYCSSNVENIQ